MQLRTPVAVGVALLVLLVPGLSHGPLVASPQVRPSARLLTDAVSLPSGADVVPLAGSTDLRLAFVLPWSNLSGLDRLLTSLEDPSSSNYRAFLTANAFEREFGPSASSVRTVEAAVAAAGGAGITVTATGVGVEATLTASAVETLLGVQLVAFDSPTLGDGYTAVGSPTLPASLAGQVVGIDGLAGYASGASLARTLAPVHSPQYVTGGSGSDWFVGTDYAQAYEATDLLPLSSSSVANATYPEGAAIATLLASGYNETYATTLPPWSPSVVDAYFNATFPSGWPLPSLTGVPVPEAGTPSPPLPGSMGGLTDSIDYVTENSLDLEMAGSLAPGAALYNFYFSGELVGNPSTAVGAPGYFTDDLATALNYNYSPARLAVISCSFGTPDLNESLWNAYLEEAAALGVTVVAASGDQGDAPSTATGRGVGAAPLWPATVAFNTSGVLSVGGVSVALSGEPTGTFTSPPLVISYDSEVGGIANTVVWSDTSGGSGHYAGSEGGTSTVYPEPFWQFDSAAQPAIVNATVRQHLSSLGRAGPDVAFPANATIVYFAKYENGSPEFVVVEGTSIAAPVFAGLLADVAAVESASAAGVTGLGFLDPELYRMASYYAATPGSASPFLPVLSGANALFSGGPGWTAATGWGGLYAPLFLTADGDPSVIGYNYTGPTPVLPSGSNPSLTTEVLTVVAIVGAATAILVAAAVVLARHRRRPGSAGPSLARPPAGTVPPPRLPYTTFACPFCGAERPAEPGRCPSCGAM